MNNKIFTYFFVVCLSFISTSLAFAQGVVDLRFGNETLDCDANEFCTTIQITAASADNFFIGTSSILFTYNTDAISYISYSPERFNGTDLCIVGAAPAWDPQQWDATSVPGIFNLTMTLTSNTFSCPEVTNAEWINVGEVCFGVKDATQSPDLIFNQTDTNFNRNEPNNGTDPITKGAFTDITGADTFECNTCTPPAAPTISVDANPICLPGTGSPVNATFSSTETPPAGFGYQWLLGGVPITGETGATLLTSTTGDFSLIFTDGAGCDGAASNSISLTSESCVVIDPVGISVSDLCNCDAGVDNDGDFINELAQVTFGVTGTSPYTITAVSGLFNSEGSALSVSDVQTLLGSGNTIVAYAEAGGANAFSIEIDGQDNSSAIVIDGPCSACPQECPTITTPTITVDANPICQDGTGTPVNATFSTTDTPPTGFGYQWILDGVPISETSSTLVTSTTGAYNLIFTSGSGCESSASNTISLTNEDCTPAEQPEISITDPCNCDLGLDNNGDFINELASETVTMTSGTAPFTVTAVTGLVDASGTALTIAMAQSLLGTGNSITAYVPADGVSTFSITIQDDNNLEASISGGPCPECPLVCPAIAAPIISADANPICDAGTGTPVNAEFSTTDTPPTGFGYQWLLGGVPISGETGATLITNTTGDYSLIFTNGDCDSEVSASITLVSQDCTPPCDVPTPTISVDANPICLSGTGTPVNAEFSTADTPPAGFSFQWLLGGVAISGETGATLLTSTTGDYSLIFTDGVDCSSLSSNIISLTNEDCTPPCNVTAPQISADVSQVCVGDANDLINVSIDVAGSEMNYAYVVTDSGDPATATILGLPGGSPIDLSGAPAGTCYIWVADHDGTLAGATVGGAVADITGCLALSNSIAIDRVDCTPTCNVTAPQISADVSQVCVGDANDLINVSIDVAGSEMNYAYVVTDSGDPATATILGLPGGSPIDLSGAPAGTCYIWVADHDGTLAGAAVGGAVADITGCLALSNSIAIDRVDCTPTCNIESGIIELPKTTYCSDELIDFGTSASTFPVGYQSAYVLTSGGIILDTNTTSDFPAQSAGSYQVHLLVYDPATLDLSTIVPGTTPASDVNALLLQGGGDICATLTLTGGEITVEDCIPECDIQSGEISLAKLTYCDDEAIDFGATTSTYPVGYQVAYVLTSGGIILDTNTSSDFPIQSIGNYQVHLLVYDPVTLDLSIVVPGTTPASDVNALLIQGGGNICATLTLTGGEFTVEDCVIPCTVTAPQISADVSQVCVGDANDLINVSIDVAGSEMNYAYVVTDSGDPATATILGLPGGSTIDLSGAPAGTCYIWVVDHDGTLAGAAVGGAVADVTGCLALSNPIAIDRIDCTPTCNVATPVISADANPICLLGTGSPVNATFSASNMPPAGYNYQWQLNGVNIAPGSGGNDPTITTSTLGTFTLIFTNGVDCESASSNAIELTSTDCTPACNVATPSISIDANPICNVGTGSPIVATLTASATPPAGFSYQWQINGVNINASSGGNASPLQTSTTGIYTLIFTDGNSCSSAASNSINLTTEDCTPSCDVSSGSLSPVDAVVCTNEVLEASHSASPDFTSEYEVVYVLTSGSGLVIEAVNTSPVFSGLSIGNYTIHTLVYDPSTLDLSTVMFGVTTGFDVNSVLIQGGGTVCGSLDVQGASFTVESCGQPCDEDIVTNSFNSSICESQTFSLLQYSNTIWTDASGMMVNAPGALQLTADACGTQTYSFFTEFEENIGDCTVPYEYTVTVTVYPTIGFVVSSITDCSVSITTCPSYTVSWSDGANSGSGTNYTATNGSAGSVVFTITDNNSANICPSSEQASFSFACGGTTDISGTDTSTTDSSGTDITGTDSSGGDTASSDDGDPFTLCGCSLDYDPVCVNGSEYVNACIAQCLGLNFTPGPCSGTGGGVTDISGSDDGSTDGTISCDNVAGTCNFTLIDFGYGTTMTEEGIYEVCPFDGIYVTVSGYTVADGYDNAYIIYTDLNDPIGSAIAINNEGSFMNNGLNVNIPFDTPLYFSGIVVPTPLVSIDMIDFDDPCIAIEAGAKTAVFQSTCGDVAFDGETDSSDEETDGSNSGICDCPDYYYPVCGDNGLSYFNECYAQCDGITNYTFGLCTDGGGTTDDTSTDDTTTDDSGTDATDGTADDSGTDSTDGNTDGTTQPDCVDEDMFMCIGHMEPIVICPEYCGFGPMDSYSITGSLSMYSCSVYMIDDHCIRYTPLPGFYGVDMVELEACSNSNSDQCYTINIEILVGNCNNTPPTATDDSSSTPQDTPISIPVLPNDFDVDNDNLTVCSNTNGANGSVTLVNGSFVYSPDNGFVGTDSFTYEICDGNGGTDTAIVTVIVTEDCDNTSYACTGHMTPIELCIDFCDDSVVIYNTHTTYDCSIEAISDHCIRYVPLPGFYATDIIEVTALTPLGNEFEIANVYITVSDDCNTADLGGSQNGRLSNPVLDLGCALTPPLAFTPNQDGINDVWKLKGTSDCSTNTMLRLSIYDKSGRLIKEQVAYAHELSWDGTNLNNSATSSGVYFYHIESIDKVNKVPNTGYIELRR